MLIGCLNETLVAPRRILGKTDPKKKGTPGHQRQARRMTTGRIPPRP